MPLNLMPHARENLAKLRDFLWDNHEEINVEMEWYGALTVEKYNNPISELAECGSVGCAVGWAPKVIPVHADYTTLNGGILYWEYALEELCKVGKGSSCFAQEVFAALFGGFWSDPDKDPSTIGVVFRIDTVLELNEIPKEFDLSTEYLSSEDEYKQVIHKYHELRTKWLKSKTEPTP